MCGIAQPQVVRTKIEQCQSHADDESRNALCPIPVHNGEKQRRKHHGLDHTNFFLEQAKHARSENQFFDERPDDNQYKNAESIVCNCAERLCFEWTQFDVQRRHQPLQSQRCHHQTTGEVQDPHIG